MRGRHSAACCVRWCACSQASIRACAQVCETNARKAFPADPSKATPAQMAAARGVMGPCYVKCFGDAVKDLPRVEKKLYE